MSIMTTVIKFLLIAVMIVYLLGHIVRMTSHYNTHQYCGIIMPHAIRVIVNSAHPITITTTELYEVFGIGYQL